MYRSVVTVLILSSVTMAQAPRKHAVQGMLVSDGVTGQKATPHGWLEEVVYVMPLNKGAGMGVRTSSNPQGGFEMPGENKNYPGFPAGRCSLFTLAYDSIMAFSIRSDLKIDEKGNATGAIDLNTSAHYSMMYNRVPAEWGESPYISGTDFYQTFVATTQHVTRIAVKLGTKSGDHVSLTLNYAIYEPDEGAPSGWKRISPVRSRTYGNNVDPVIHIYHVAYHSDEISLKPGKTYAVRFWRDPSSVAETFTIVARSDKGDGYRNGHLYRGNDPLEKLDAYAYISGGAPGTVVNHAPVGDPGMKKFAGSAQRFGQTFRASGTSLAGIDTIYADGNVKPPSIPIQFQMYDRPGGQPIGPARECYGLPLTFQARAAAVWMPGEVPLVPGRTYYLEWTLPKLFNMWVLNEDLPGEAYRDGKAMPDSDLAMSMVEYDGAGSDRISHPAR